jgi:hypothetical protein
MDIMAIDEIRRATILDTATHAVDDGKLPRELEPFILEAHLGNEDSFTMVVGELQANDYDWTDSTGQSYYIPPGIPSNARKIFYDKVDSDWEWPFPRTDIGDDISPTDISIVREGTFETSAVKAASDDNEPIIYPPKGVSREDWKRILEETWAKVTDPKRKGDAPELPFIIPTEPPEIDRRPQIPLHDLPVGPPPTPDGSGDEQKRGVVIIEFASADLASKAFAGFIDLDSYFAPTVIADDDQPSSTLHSDAIMQSGMDFALAPGAITPSSTGMGRPIAR